MMRFIDIGTQIGPGDDVSDDWPRQFAFFDTITDTFITASGNQVWDCWDDLHSDLLEERKRTKHTQQVDEHIARLKRLCPDWVFEANQS